MTGDKSWMDKERDSVEWQIGMKNFLNFAFHGAHPNSTVPTSRKWAYGPGSVGPSVPVAQPGLANRDQCWSRLGHEPGPMGAHVASSGWAWGETHWSRFVLRTGTNECFFFVFRV